MNSMQDMNLNGVSKYQCSTPDAMATNSNLVNHHEILVWDANTFFVWFSIFFYFITVHEHCDT